MSEPSPRIEIERHKTALHRVALSRPMATALGDGLLTKDRSIFDYGCGRGADIKLLERRGYKIAGWDPHYLPKSERTGADIVNLGYVLNVIEDPKERRDALTAAFALARKLLIVAVRVDNSLQSDTEMEDGVVTTIKTFQKIFSQVEFKDFVKSVSTSSRKRRISASSTSSRMMRFSLNIWRAAPTARAARFNSI